MKKRITIRVTEKQREELEMFAKEWDIDLSKLLREVIIDRWLDEQVGKEGGR